MEGRQLGTGLKIKEISPQQGHELLWEMFYSVFLPVLIIGFVRLGVRETSRDISAPSTNLKDEHWTNPDPNQKKLITVKPCICAFFKSWINLGKPSPSF